MTRIVITGASGFIGKQIVPELSIPDFELLLVGRKLNELSELFPNHRVCSYEQLEYQAKNYDALLNLAVINNDLVDGLENSHTNNIALFRNILALAKKAKIRRFYNFSSFHAFSNRNSDYARSKRECINIAKNSRGIAITNFFMPNVYGTKFCGKLYFANKLPNWLSDLIILISKSMVPTVHIGIICSTLINHFQSNEKTTDIFLSDPIEEKQIYTLFKFLLDICFLIILAGFFWWLFIAISVAIRVDSSGPVIFRQERIGLNMKPFICFKFRTMKEGTKDVGTYDLRGDEITKVGALLRKSKLDELPQAYNILRGELTLIGPRPCLPSQTTLIKERHSTGVYTLKPGITGLSQVKGIDMRDPILLNKMDTFYKFSRSILGDIGILLQTFLPKSFGDRLSTKKKIKSD